MEPSKRQHYRLPIQSPVAFKIIRGKNLDERTPPLNGMIKNISLGGLQFGTNTLNHGDLFIFNEFERVRDRAFKPNVLLVRFSLPGEEEPFIIYCQPRWSDQGDLVDSYEFYIGVKFIKAKPGDLERLQDYIQNHSNQAALKNFYQQKKDEYRKRKTEEILIQKYVLAALPIRYQIISSKENKKSRAINAVTRNLSAFGLCVQVEDIDADGIHMVFNDTPLNRNTLQLEISIPKQQPFSVIGEVRWFERVSGEGKYNYNVGIKFLKISEKDIKTIVDYIKDKPEDISGVSRRG
jgi:hypothetical protein